MVNISFDAPREMLELAKSPEAREKPYNLCLKCPFMNKSCDGPNILSMEYPRWVEWANDRAKQLGLTRAAISELSNVPKGTVDTALAGKNADIRTATMRDITKVLIGGCWGQYPCHFASLLINDKLAGGEDESVIEGLRRQLDEAQANLFEKRELNESNARAVDFLKAQIAFKEKQMEIKDERIDKLSGAIEGWRRVVKLLAVLLGIAVLVIIVFLAIDVANPNIGWMRG